MEGAKHSVQLLCHFDQMQSTIVFNGVGVRAISRGWVKRTKTQISLNASSCDSLIDNEKPFRSLWREVMAEAFS